MSSSPSPNPASYNTTDKYSSTARSLAFSVSPPSSPSAQAKNFRPSWPRRTSTANSTSALWSRRRGSDASTAALPLSRRLLRTSDKYLRRLLRLWRNLTPVQKIALVVAGVVTNVLGIMFLVYSESVFEWLKPVAERWKEMPGGWAILWAATFVTAFPPMIGYSTCVTLAGFVFGMPGWFIIATANVVGSLCSFLLFRNLLSGFAKKLAARDPRFAAFGLVVAHDGLPLMVLIRLTPLPYSLSNGGLSTIQTIKAWQFAVATAAATPKLLIHVFIGTRLRQLAGGSLDAGTKAINWVSIIIGVVLGAATGIVIYRRTVARARVLEAEERRKLNSENARNGRLEPPDAFEEDEDEDAMNVAGDVIDFIDGDYADERDERRVKGYTDDRYVDEDHGESVSEGEDEEGRIGLKNTGKRR